MASDASSSQALSELNFNDPFYSASSGNFTQTPFAPDGMSEICGGSSVADSQAQQQNTDSIFGFCGAAAEPAGANGAEDQAQAIETSGDVPSKDVAVTDEAAETSIEEPVQTTKLARDLQAELGGDDPVEVSETMEIVQAVENNEPARQQSAPVAEEARGRPRSRSQSSRASKALMPPPQLPDTIQDTEVIGSTRTENDPPAKDFTRPLNLGSSMLGRKKTGQSARERLLEKQAENRARHQASPAVRQSIERDAATTAAPAGSSDVEIIDSRQFHQCEASVFGQTRQVLRYKRLMSPRRQRTPSQQPGGLMDSRSERVAAAFREVEALFHEKKQAGSLSTDEKIEFMNIEAQEKDRLRKKTIDAMSRRPSSVGPRRVPSFAPRRTPEAESLYVGDDRLRRYQSKRPGSQMPRDYRRASSEMPRDHRRASSEMPQASGRSSSRHSSSREGPNANSRKRSFREASVNLDPDGQTGSFQWRTPQGKSTSSFSRFNKHDQQEFTDAEMNASLDVAKRQRDDAYNRRDRVHVEDGFAEEISFGDYFLEACKNEDRNGVPEAYLENCVEMIAKTIRTQVHRPQYKGVPTKLRLEKYRTMWKQPSKKSRHTGRDLVDKHAVDHEFDKRKHYVYSKIRTSQITVEQAARFALEWDIQRSRLQRRYLHDAGRSRTQPYPQASSSANAAGQPANNNGPLRLPESAQFDTALKPDFKPLVEEASQMLAEALFHVGAASHRIQQCFNNDNNTMPPPPPAPSRVPTPAARNVAEDTEGFQSEVQSENGDLFAND
ncbi:Hypothetical predicted protein [Lecanosticta acicola]|uniref:Uncharacterized protein n=1 Tax=Lecanosticta acicola TaxID=111012 RepID=A0AAI8YVU6_9PEZI|nr:Hypothetical predicted protein [Lecanosticta acicola]